MIETYFDKYTFQYLMDKAISHVPDTIDKREGSIIYDAIAPACYELAEYYMEMQMILTNTFVATAHDEFLNLRVAERGLTRNLATYAVKKGVFVNGADAPTVISVGSRFSTISDTKAVNYYVSEVYANVDDIVVPGSYKLICETVGVIGNNYTGPLIPITYIPDLKSATMSDLLIPARDAEDDETLRNRYFSTFRETFGGNIAEYDAEIRAIAGVGEVQIYPVWAGGGTVKCSVVDTQFNTITPEFTEYILNAIDPESVSGQRGTGLGEAPIGHTVTITTPNIATINITAKVTLATGYILSQVEAPIAVKMEEYLLNLRKIWGIGSELNEYSLAVYIARINAAILEVTGVVNVVNTTINTVAADLTLAQTAVTQELPQLGTVIISV